MLESLVRDMWQHVYNDCGYFTSDNCDGCEHADGGWCSAARRFEERMKQLGIEADDE